MPSDNVCGVRVGTVYSFFGFVRVTSTVDSVLILMLMLTIISNWHRLHIRLQAHSICVRTLDTLIAAAWQRKWKLLFCCEPINCSMSTATTTHTKNTHAKINVTSKAETRADLHLNLLLPFAEAPRQTGPVRPLWTTDKQFQISTIEAVRVWERALGRTDTKQHWCWHSTYLLLLLRCCFSVMVVFSLLSATLWMNEI